MIWVLMDLSYLTHRARHAISNMEYEDFPTGIIYGFFEQFRTICRDWRVNSNQVVVFADSKKSHRKTEYPEYKSKRYEKLDEKERRLLSAMRDQAKLLRTKILPDMGITVLRQTGLESDDLMADAAKQFVGPETKAVLITSDGDMFQCITESVHWYDPGRNVYFDPYSFNKTKGIPSYMWGEVKTLGGCSTDCVRGVPGVGEKTAIRYLKGGLPDHYKSFQAIESASGRKTQKRNRGLVILPHRKTKPVRLKKPEYNTDAFFHYCERYGIVSYLQKKKMRGWESFFKQPRMKLRRRRG